MKFLIFTLLMSHYLLSKFSYSLKRKMAFGIMSLLLLPHLPPFLVLVKFSFKNHALGSFFESKMACALATFSIVSLVAFSRFYRVFSSGNILNFLLNFLANSILLHIAFPRLFALTRHLYGHISYFCVLPDFW